MYGACTSAGSSYHTMPYHIIPYHTIPYRNVPYRTVPYPTVPYRTVPYRTVPYRTVLYRTVPYRTVPYRTIPYHTIPYHTIPYHTIPYHTIPYHTIPYQNARKTINLNGRWALELRGSCRAVYAMYESAFPMPYPCLFPTTTPHLPLTDIFNQKILSSRAVQLRQKVCHDVRSEPNCWSLTSAKTRAHNSLHHCTSGACPYLSPSITTCPCRTLGSGVRQGRDQTVHWGPRNAQSIE